MTVSQRSQVIALAILAVAGGVFGQGRPEGSRGDTFRDMAAIEEWAKQGYFGGASVTKYSKDDRELVVVNGTPTSGLLTSQVVVFGRAARNLVSQTQTSVESEVESAAAWRNERNRCQ